MACLTPAQRHQLRVLDRAENSRAVNRCHKNLASRSIDHETQITVLGLLAVEVVARPISFRLMEWILASLAPRRIGEAFTLGPFQIKGGPFFLDDAISLVLKALSQVDTANLPQVALLWNGPAAHRRTRPDL